MDDATSRQILSRPLAAGEGQLPVARRMRWRFNDSWMILPSAIFLAAFFAIPLLFMVNLSLNSTWSLDNYERVLRASVYYKVAIHTFVLSAGVTLICLILGYPLAYLLAAVPGRFRRWLLIPLMIPYLTSLMVRSYAWMVLLGREGLINQFLSFFGIGPFQLMNNALGTYVGMVHTMLPLMVLALFAKFVNIDMRLVSAGRSLGASPSFVFFRVYFPLSFPGIAAGCSLVLITSLGFFIIPAILGGMKDQTIATLIERQVNVSLNWEFASTLGILLLVLTISLLILGKLLGQLASRSLGLSARPRRAARL